MNFWCSIGHKWNPPFPPPPQTQEQTLEKVSQGGIWNILSHSTFVPSICQIGWPPLLAPGTLSQTGTLNTQSSSFQSWVLLRTRSIQYIVNLVADEITPQTNRNLAVLTVMQVLVAFRLLVSGLFLHVIGDTFLGFDKSTVSRVVRLRHKPWLRN